MAFEDHSYDTRLATLRRTAPQLVEVHFKEGLTTTVDGVREIHAVRRKLFGEASYAMLVVVPAENDFQLDATRVDYHAGERATEPLLAIAVVAPGRMVEMMAKLYFSYYPQLFRTLVTSNEDEARAWLQDQLQEIARTGS